MSIISIGMSSLESALLTSNFTVTLEEFQASDGIPFVNQIILLNNRKTFSDFAPVIFPYAKSRKLLRRLDKLLRGRGCNGHEEVHLPLRRNKLFLGYFDKSMDNPYAELKALFQLIRKRTEREFILVLGKGDWELEAELVRDLPENLLAIAANNINVKHPKVRYLPMGRDFRNLDLLSTARPRGKKNMLCYCNFSLNTHPVRNEIYEDLRSKPFINFDHMGKFLEYSISRETFLRKLESAKFCICPRGNAVETFRMWDCLYSGTIPIVVKESAFHEELSDLPILFLDNAAEFRNLDQDQLEEIYAQYLRTSFNYAKLTANYWFKSIGTTR